MKSGIDHVIHSELRKPGEEFKLLYYPYNGIYEWLYHSDMIKCYGNMEDIIYEWKTGSFPSSINHLKYGLYNVPQRLDFDAVVCNHRYEQVFKAQQISEYYHLPLIIIEHELPAKESKENIRKYVNSRMPKKAIHVITDPLVAKEWCLEKEYEYIPYGFKPQKSLLRTNDIIVIGDYNVEDFGLLNGMMSCHPKIKGYGFNQGITQEYKSFEDLTNILCQSRIVILGNGSVRSPLLTMLAMSCGAMVMTNRTRWTENIITHQENGILFESIKELRGFSKKYMSDEDEVAKIALAGQSMILEKYPYTKSLSMWQELLQKVSKEVYIR